MIDSTKKCQQILKCLLMILVFSNCFAFASDKIDDQRSVLREAYLDFFYWLEAISQAPLMLAEDSFAEELPCPEIKRVFLLSNPGTHMLDEFYFQLKNGYGSAAYFGGERFDRQLLPDEVKQNHEAFITNQKKIRAEISPYQNDCVDEGKTFQKVVADSITPMYQRMYEKYKAWLLDYDAVDVPYMEGEGAKRARQWIRYEKLAQLEDSLGKLLVEFWMLAENHAFCATHKNFQHAEYPEKVIKQIVALRNDAGYREFLPDFITDISVDFTAINQIFYVNQALMKVRKAMDEARPPYNITSLSVDYTRNEELAEAGVNVHFIALMSLEALESFREEQKNWRLTKIDQPVKALQVINKYGLKSMESGLH